MNWFQRHLNWTYVFNLVAINLAIIPYILLIATIDPDFKLLSPEAYYASFIIVAFLWLIGISIWVLKRKSRSFWNLLWLIVPFGLLFFLAIENKSYRDEDKKKEDSTGEAELRLIEDSEITGKSEQEDYMWVCDKCGAEIAEGDKVCPKCGVEFEEEPIHQDSKIEAEWKLLEDDGIILEEIILEENKQYLKYRPHKCPYCNSTKISESVVHVPKSDKEKKLVGYSYLWEGNCASCSASWYSVEGGKQLSKNEEPTKSDDEIRTDIELETNYCYKCGRGITSGMAFCPKCGHKLS